MIDYVKGELAELTPTYAVVDCGGVGYGVNITLIDFDALQGKRQCKLFVHEAIREDAHLLYGFLQSEAREMFRLLLGVSGVGANTARLILSAMNAGQLQEIISSGNDAMLRKVKGIGGKTAQRIIVDLQDKIKAAGISFISSGPVAGEAYDDALSALVMLGFTSQASQKALKKLFSDDPAMTTEKAIKLALTML